jgi:energy-coupling factor transporter ATP-binding protein EcfA2
MRARDNPFRVERLHELAFRFREGSMADLLDRLIAQQWRGAIVGPHGSGKTTLVEELVRFLQQRSIPTERLRITEADAGHQSELVAEWLSRASPDALLILDGAEQLPRRVWRDVWNRSQKFRGLLITCHQPGLLPTLYESRTDENLLRELVWTLASGMSYPCFSDASLTALYQKHRGNIRDCLRELYDVVSQG